MAENIIKIELGEESRKLLASIDGTLLNLLKEIRIVSDTTECIRLALASAGTPYDAPAPEQPQEPEEEEAPAPLSQDVIMPTPEPRKVDRETVRKLVVDLSATDKKAQVREIVKAYAESVTAIPEDKLPEVWDKLTELEAKKKVRL